MDSVLSIGWQKNHHYGGSSLVHLIIISLIKFSDIKKNIKQIPKKIQLQSQKSTIDWMTRFFIFHLAIGGKKTHDCGQIKLNNKKNVKKSKTEWWNEIYLLRSHSLFLCVMIGTYKICNHFVTWEGKNTYIHANTHTIQYICHICDVIVVMYTHERKFKSYDLSVHLIIINC